MPQPSSYGIDHGSAVAQRLPCPVAVATFTALLAGHATPLGRRG